MTDQPSRDRDGRDGTVDNSATDEQGQPRKLGEVVSKGTPVMLVTPGPDGLAARPLICGSAEEQTLRFLVDRSADWMAELQADGATAAGLLVMSDPAHATFAWAQVDISVAYGRGAVDSLWSPAVAAFFDGPDDENLAILVVRGATGQWWDGPSSALGRAFAITRAAVTQNPESLGAHGQFG
jgi:general stress protein 26